MRVGLELTKSGRGHRVVRRSSVGPVGRLSASCFCLTIRGCRLVVTSSPNAAQARHKRRKGPVFAGVLEAWQRPHNPSVAGSKPAGPTQKSPVATGLFVYRSDRPRGRMRSSATEMQPSDSASDRRGHPRGGSSALLRRRVHVEGERRPDVFVTEQGPDCLRVLTFGR